MIYIILVQYVVIQWVTYYTQNYNSIVILICQQPIHTDKSIILVYTQNEQENASRSAVSLLAFSDIIYHVEWVCVCTQPSQLSCSQTIMQSRSQSVTDDGYYILCKRGRAHYRISYPTLRHSAIKQTNSKWQLHMLSNSHTQCWLGHRRSLVWDSCHLSAHHNWEGYWSEEQLLNSW